MTYEQAQLAARDRKKIILRLPLTGEMEYTATDVAKMRRGGKEFEIMRLEDATGCVVIAAVKNCEVKE